MGIDLSMSGLEACPDARCAPQRRDIVGYDPTWKRGEDEAAATVVRFERLDSPWCDKSSQLEELASSVGRFDATHYAVLYDHELMPIHQDLMEIVGPLFERHKRFLGIIDRRVFEERIARYAEDAESKKGLVSWWRRESAENCDLLCATCPLKLPFDYRTDCHGWLSSYPRLPLAERTLASAVCRMARLDELGDALPDELRQGLARAGLTTFREAIAGLSAVLPTEGPAVTKWEIEWVWKSFAASLNEALTGCDLLQHEPQRQRSDLAEHILDCLVFKEPDIAPALAAKLLPFFEAALPVMEAEARQDPGGYSVAGWREFLACLRNVVRFGVVLSVSI